MNQIIISRIEYKINPHTSIMYGKIKSLRLKEVKKILAKVYIAPLWESEDLEFGRLPVYHTVLSLGHSFVYVSILYKIESHY